MPTLAWVEQQGTAERIVFAGLWLEVAQDRTRERITESGCVGEDMPNGRLPPERRSIHFVPLLQRLQLGLQSLQSTGFARECLLQRRQSVERGGRQPTFLGRRERILELLRRCHTDQDNAHRRMRERKPRGGFGQARGKALLDQRPQAAGARDIGVVSSWPSRSARSAGWQSDDARPSRAARRPRARR